MQRRLKFERLEQREMLSSTSWIAGSGLWSSVSNWSNGVPTSSVAAIISPSSPATITIQPGETDAAQSLTLGSNAALSMPTNGDPSLPTSNLIANPGFESPKTTNNTTQPSSWACGGSAYLSTQYAYNGAQSLVLSGNNSLVNQTFSAAPNTSYTVSVDAMTPAGNALSGSLDAQMAVWYFDSSWNWLGFGTYYTTIMSSATAPGGPLAGSVGNQGWNRYFVTTSAAPGNAAYVGVQLQVYANTSSYGGAAYFDAVQFGPAAAGPSTLALGSLVNNGSITIGPTNQVNVSGNFTQNSTGALNVQLNGSAQEAGAVKTDMLGSLAVTGTAALAGTLQASLVYGYTPTTTDTFTPITFASCTGGFTSTSLPSGSGYQLGSATSFTNVVVSAAPSASATTTVSVGTTLHTVATGLSGVNLTLWDSSAVSSQTQQLTAALGLNLFRFPGGSASDLLHFDLLPDTWDLTFPQFAQGIAASGGSGMATLDYGSASPQEAAAEVAYLLGSPGDMASLGEGLQWMTNGNNGSGAWAWVNWQTAGYWASLRGASPLAVDDGFNFLRIDHPAPFSTIKYFEVGNEVSGSWEPDHHGMPGPGGVSTGAAHDAATYAAFCCQFVALAQPIVAAAALPPLSIGIIAGDVTQSGPDSWTTTVLTACKNVGFVPSFLIDHNYVEGGGSENDNYLLNDTVSDPYSYFGWSTRYSNLESQLQQALGSQASSVNIMTTEFNSISGDDGKQSTSLVNGLFIAEAMGGLIDSNYAGATVWDLRNGNQLGTNDSNLLYGWREWGDYGLLDGYIAYPNYFAEQLASKLVVAGGQVVSAVSNYGDLDVYAVRQSNGHLDLLVINTNPAAAITSQFNLTGFQPTGAAQAWQYGKAEDLAQSQSSTAAASLTYSSTTLSLSGANFSYTFPSYSMTVLDLTANQTLSSIAVTPAAARVAPGKTEQFTATAYDQYGDPMATQPTFTWSLASGVGSVNSSSGLYTAPAATGSAGVQATSGGLSGTASVTVTNVPPTVATAAAAAPNPVIGSAAALSVLGADDGGEANLTYTWSAVSVPTGAAVAFSANGTNAAQNAIATFNEAGVYNLQATITDLAGLTVTSAVSVTVDQTLTSVAVTPGNLTLAANSHEQFAAMAYDQFGNAMASQPSFVWSASNSPLASIGATGLYTTGSLQGAAAVTAAVGALSASAAVNVTSLPVPLAWYRFNEGGGYTALDSSGNGLSGVISSSVNYDTSAPTGSDLIFNGSSSGYVTVPPLDLNSNTVTMSGWVKRNGAQSDYTGIVFYRNGSGTASGISMRSTGALAYHWNDASATWSWSSGLTVPNGVWTFVALVITPSNATMYMQPAGAAMQSAVNALSNAAQAFSGVSYVGQDPLGGRFFNGGIGDVRIYNAGLSATQVAQLYDSYYPPTVATAAAASPATVTGKTTALSALGSSILGAGGLTYTWSSSGPGTVTFSPNGANAAENATATFSAAGTYTLGVTIADIYGQFTTSSVNVTVNQTFTSIAVALAANKLAATGVEQFAATADDQFNSPMAIQPTFTWSFSSVVSGGAIDSSGDFQPPYAVGSAVISAAAGGKTGQSTAAYPGIAQWNSAGGGLWSGGSWIGTTSAATISPPGLRAAAGDYAQFATAGGTISLSGVTPSLAGLSFASANGYTLSGGAMNLGIGASPGTITVSIGNHTITTPVTLQSNLTVAVAASGSLTITGGVGGSGESLTLSGPGKLVLGGNNSFNGGATVLSGTLVVAGPNALPNGSNLAVGANVGSLFAAATASPIASFPTTIAIASIAAPGTNGQGADAAGGGPPPPSLPASRTATSVSAARDRLGGASSATHGLDAVRAAQAAVIAADFARRSAADVTWFRYLQSAVASAGQKDSRSIALEALDAVLAAYSRE